jgi:putative toxin-antitoxin system antitoxin component (TIGR02293 family)
MPSPSAQTLFHPQQPPAGSLLVELGIAPPDGAGLSQWVKQGVPYRVFDRLRVELGLSQARLARLTAIPVTTLKRRAAEGRFNPHEGDRLLRLATVLERAIELCEGDREQARCWLSTPARALAGAIPLAQLETETGAREVLDLIGRLQHGVFA